MSVLGQVVGIEWLPMRRQHREGRCLASRHTMFLGGRAGLSHFSAPQATCLVLCLLFPVPFGLRAVHGFQLLLAA